MRRPYKRNIPVFLSQLNFHPNSLYDFATLPFVTRSSFSFSFFFCRLQNLPKPGFLLIPSLFRILFNVEKIVLYLKFKDTKCFTTDDLFHVGSLL